MRSAINTAARQGGSWAGVLGSDPAVRLSLQREHPDESEGPSELDSNTSPSPEDHVAVEGPFSPGFSGPGSFFSVHEVVVDSFASLTNEVQQLAARNGDLSFVWRGQQDADWGLHSSLYRRLMRHLKVPSPAEAPGPEVGLAYPDEAMMLAAEMAILDEAVEWRMSETSALEIFARLQHHGGPSRLLDVTRNPLIATWFAVEGGIADTDDARLFALASGHATGHEPSSSAPIISEQLAGSRYPFWTYGTTQERAAADWGTGSRRRLWIPPAYDARIAAQNAAFLLEGVPYADPRHHEVTSVRDGQQEVEFRRRCCVDVDLREANAPTYASSRYKSELGAALHVSNQGRS